jgi:hypothetical protein
MGSAPSPAADESSFAAGSSSTSSKSVSVNEEEFSVPKVDEIGVHTAFDSHETDCSMIAANVAAHGNSTTILDLETKFLEAHFDEALLMANQYLEDEHMQRHSERLKDPSSWSRVATPICFCFDITRQRRYIYWKYSDENTSADEICQVATIALQSWYELCQKEKKQKRHQSSDKGNRFLLPFLDTFTSSVLGTVPIWPMSIDLLTLFIRFLSSPDVGQGIQAVFISAEFLRDIRSSSFDQDTASNTNIDDKFLSTVDEACCKELVVYFFAELLPNHCGSPDAVVDLLIGIALPSNVSNDMMIAEKHFVTNANENDLSRKDVVQLCLKFCNTDEGYWPRWIQDAFRKCRIKLQAQLREIYDRRHNDISYRDGNENDKKSQVMAPLVHNKQSKRILRNALNNIRRLLSQQLQLLTTLIREGNMNSMTLSQKRQIQMSSLAFCLALFYWKRYRKKQVFKIVGVALWRVVWKPLMEVLQAIKP